MAAGTRTGATEPTAPSTSRTASMPASSFPAAERMSAAATITAARITAGTRPRGPEGPPSSCWLVALDMSVLSQLHGGGGLGPRQGDFLGRGAPEGVGHFEPHGLRLAKIEVNLHRRLLGELGAVGLSVG